MKRRRVKFKINKDLGKRKLLNFIYRDEKAGINFKELIFKAHPTLKGIEKLEKEEAKRKVNMYIDDLYLKNKDGIKKTVAQMQKDWREIEDEFFEITNHVFKNLPWPKGEYIAYFSISPPCPRYLYNKTFSVVYTKDGRWKKIVAHEMLHFMFYEYIRKKYMPNLKNTIEKEMNIQLEKTFIFPLWDISEIFNAIVMNEGGFQKLLPYPSEPYPKHKEAYKKLQKIWIDSDKDIEVFLKSIEAQ